MVNYLLSLSFIVAVGLYFKAKLNCYSQGCVCVCVCVAFFKYFYNTLCKLFWLDYGSACVKNIIFRLICIM